MLAVRSMSTLPAIEQPDAARKISQSHLNGEAVTPEVADTLPATLHERAGGCIHALAE